MILSSWNLNGIRAGIKKGTFFPFLEKKSPDIIGLQEVKSNIYQIDSIFLEKIKSFGYEIFWNGAQKLGYSGTAIFTKIKPLSIFYGIDISNIDLKINENILKESIQKDKVINNNYEGRVITLEFENFFYINVYTPNSKSDLSRLKYRKIWDYIFLEYCKKLDKIKPVIFCLDLNVAHKEIDLANPNANKTTLKRPGNAGFTDTERKGFSNFLKNGFIDSYRYLYPFEEKKYTWWSNFGKSREKNIGWRIDYFIVSEKLKKEIKDSYIHMDIIGSDHCPISLELK